MTEIRHDASTFLRSSFPAELC